MSSRDRLVDEIERLRDTLAVFETSPREANSAIELAFDGLMRRQEQLAASLRAIDRRELDVVVDGPPVLDQSVRIDFLSKLLDELQESVSSIGQASIGEPTSRGSIDSELRESTLLRLSGTFPGSFGLELVGPTAGPVQGAIFTEAVDASDMDLFDSSVDALMGVLEATEDDNYSAEILSHVSGLGSRAIKHLKGLSNVLVEVGQATDFTWHSPEEPRAVRVDQTRAERLRDVLTHTESTEREMTVDGHLGGASMIHGRFELKLPDDSVLTGRVDQSVLSTLAEFFDRDCVATLRVKTAKHTVDGTERESYTLVGIS